MTPPLSFDTLQSILHQRLEQLPNHRKAGPNTQYRIHDAALGAFGIFFTQSPSFLDYQRTLQQNKGQNNAHTLLGVEQIPCDNQVRTLLDPIAPSYLDPVFVEVFEGLAQRRMLTHFRVLGDQRRFDCQTERRARPPIAEAVHGGYGTQFFDEPGKH